MAQEGKMEDHNQTMAALNRRENTQPLIGRKKDL